MDERHFEVVCTGCGRGITGTEQSVAQLMARRAVCPYCRGAYRWPEELQHLVPDEGVHEEVLTDEVRTASPAVDTDETAPTELAPPDEDLSVPPVDDLSAPPEPDLPLRPRPPIVERSLPQRPRPVSAAQGAPAPAAKPGTASQSAARVPIVQGEAAPTALPWQDELPIWLIEAGIVAVIGAALLRNGVWGSPWWGALFGAGAVLGMLVASLTFAQLRDARFSLTRGRGAWRLWLLLGLSVVFLPLGALLGAANGRIRTALGSSLTQPVFSGFMGACALAVACLGLTHDGFAPLRARIESAQVDTSYALTPGPWSGTVKLPGGFLPTDKMMMDLMEDMGFEGFLMEVHVDSVEGDTWKGRMAWPELRFAWDVAGVHKGNRILFALEKATKGGGPTGDILDGEVDEEGLWTGKNVDGEVTFKLEEGALEGMEDPGTIQDFLQAAEGGFQQEGPASL